MPQVIRGEEPPGQARADLHIQKIGVDYSGAFEIVCSIYGIPIQLEPWLIAPVNRPRWHHPLSFDWNQPLAGAALFGDGNSGWTGFDGTLPSYCRRGAETTLLLQRLCDGVRLDCE